MANKETPTNKKSKTPTTSNHQEGSRRPPLLLHKLEKKLLKALRTDVDGLANKFNKQKTAELDYFVKLFNELEFSTIFLGRLSISDLAEVV